MFKAKRILQRYPLLFALCVLLSGVAHAQYTTSYQTGVADLTAQIITGTNPWHELASPMYCHAIQGGGDGYEWCLGSDSYIYMWSIDSQTWEKRTDMGTVIAFAVANAGVIWSLQNYSGCHGSYGMFHWNNSNAWTQPNTSICMTGIAAANDASIVTVDGTNIYQSLDNGQTYTQLNSGSYLQWKIGNTADQNTICAIQNGSMFWLTSSGLAKFSPQPPTTPVKCVISQDDPVIFAWDASGNAYLYDSTNSVWHSVTGLLVADLASDSKAYTVALDKNTGYAYHYNAYAGFAEMTTTGSWDHCPGANGNCPPGVTHSIKGLEVDFPHNTVQVIGTGSASPTGNLNVSGWSTNVNCDPIFGNPGDPECQPAAAGDNGCVLCSFSGEFLECPTSFPTKSYSVSYVEWNGARYITPTGCLGGVCGAEVECGVRPACLPGTSAVCTAQEIVGHGISNTQERAVSAAALVCVLKQPWSVLSVYSAVGGNNLCTYVSKKDNAAVPGYCN